MGSSDVEAIVSALAERLEAPRVALAAQDERLKATQERIHDHEDRLREAERLPALIDRLELNADNQMKATDLLIERIKSHDERLISLETTRSNQAFGAKMLAAIWTFIIALLGMFGWHVFKSAKP